MEDPLQVITGRDGDQGNFNCRREMYPQDEGHLRMTWSLGSKSTTKKG